MGVRAGWEGVPPVRGGDSVEENGIGCEAHLLVPSVSAGVTSRHRFPVNVPVPQAEPSQPDRVGAQLQFQRCTPGASWPVRSTYSTYDPGYTCGWASVPLSPPSSSTRLLKPPRNARSCDTNSIVPSKSSSAPSSISFVARSRWFVGSSSTRKFGGVCSMRACTNRGLSPPEIPRLLLSISFP